MELFLDPDDPRPQKVQLYEQLRTAIVEGRLTPGDRLTPSRMMAAESRAGVSRRPLARIVPFSSMTPPLILVPPISNPIVAVTTSTFALVIHRNVLNGITIGIRVRVRT